MTTTDSHKNVTKKRHDFTKSEREYVKSLVVSQLLGID